MYRRTLRINQESQRVLKILKQVGFQCLRMQKQKISRVLHGCHHLPHRSKPLSGRALPPRGEATLPETEGWWTQGLSPIHIRLHLHIQLRSRGRHRLAKDNLKSTYPKTSILMKHLSIQRILSTMLSTLTSTVIRLRLKSLQK